MGPGNWPPSRPRPGPCSQLKEAQGLTLQQLLAFRAEQSVQSSEAAFLALLSPAPPKYGSLDLLAYIYLRKRMSERNYTVAAVGKPSPLVPNSTCVPKCALQTRDTNCGTDAAPRFAVCGLALCTRGRPTW